MATFRPLSRREQEAGPKVGGLGVPEADPEDLAASFARDGGGDHERLGDDPASHSDGEVGGVQEQVGEPGVVEAACQEVGDGLVDLGADPRHGRTAHTGLVAQGAHQLVDLTGGDAVDPGLADHRVQGLVDPSARRKQGGEERSFPQLGDRQFHLASRRRQRLGARPVPPGRALGGPLVRGRTDPRGRFGVDQVLQSRLQHPSEHVRVGRGRDRSGLPGSARTRQTGYGSSRDHFFASCRKQQGPPTMAPLHLNDDEPPAGSDTTLRDTPVAIP